MTRTEGPAQDRDLKEKGVDAQAAQKENAPSDASFPLSPHPVLEHRLQQQPDEGQSRTSLEAYVLVSSVRITSVEAPKGESQARSTNSKNATQQRGSHQRRNDNGSEAKWLFPAGLVSEPSQQQELLQVVQRYRKKAPSQQTTK